MRETPDASLEEKEKFTKFLKTMFQRTQLNSRESMQLIKRCGMVESREISIFQEHLEIMSTKTHNIYHRSNRPSLLFQTLS
jgi:hypothetical protein